MANPTQASHPAQLSTVLGQDKLLLEHFTATERLSVPFSIVIEALSPDGAIDFMPQLGTGVGVTIDSGVSVIDRYFHGVLFEAEAVEQIGAYMRYRLTLRPWLSLLSLGRNTRIFQQMTVKAIIDSVFSAAGFSNYQFKMTTAGLQTREYCVQFRESDFDFVSRLMEEEGIYYYFSHTQSSHTLVLCDDPSCHAPFSSTGTVLRGDTVKFTAPHLIAWNRRVRPSAIKATLWDSHFCKPGQSLEAKSQASSASTAEAAEVYDYPGRYGYFDDAGARAGTDYVTARLQEARAERDSYQGAGDFFGVPVGDRLTIDDDGQTSDFLVIGATHTMGVQHYAAVGGSDDPVEFSIELDAVPAAVVWRPARVTPKPVAGGPQTATVVGTSGEVIDVDQYGRVRVQFPWDRIGTNDQKSSCWLRVSQSSADNGFGHMHIPRIGEEVIVDFLDGDPDRPIITGRVYNSTQVTPYALPADKTKSTWKSQTVGQSGSYDGAEGSPPSPGYNEVRFEDKGGSEELFVHAQRLFTALVELDENRTTNRDTTVRVGRNRTVNVKQNETVTIEQGDESRTLQTGSRTTTIQKSDSTTLQTGDYSLTVSAGQATLEAMQQITLKVGSNTIVVSQQGIELKGLMIKATADTDLSVQGLTTELKASTMMTISGALVSIN
jgi:type VI secretion system secreted protein VgrG